MEAEDHLLVRGVVLLEVAGGRCCSLRRPCIWFQVLHYLYIRVHRALRRSISFGVMPPWPQIPPPLDESA